MSTRAIKFLEQRGIPFEVGKYEHTEKGAGFAAGATLGDLEELRYGPVLVQLYGCGRVPQYH